MPARNRVSADAGRTEAAWAQQAGLAESLSHAGGLFDRETRRIPTPTEPKDHRHSPERAEQAAEFPQ